MIKKIVFAALVAATSSGAYAAIVCSGGNGTAIADSTTNFIRVGFTPKCSASTEVDVTQSASGVGVGSVSLKGKSIFAGSSNGGGVQKTADCAADPCTPGEATDAADTALNGTSS